MNEVGAMLGRVMLKNWRQGPAAVERGGLVVRHGDVLDRRDEQQHRETRPGPGCRHHHHEQREIRVRLPRNGVSAELLDDVVDQSEVLAEHPPPQDTHDDGRQQPRDEEDDTGDRPALGVLAHHQVGGEQRDHEVQRDEEDGVQQRPGQRVVERGVPEQVVVVVQPDPLEHPHARVVREGVDEPDHRRPDEEQREEHDVGRDEDERRKGVLTASPGRARGHVRGAFCHLPDSVLVEGIAVGSGHEPGITWTARAGRRGRDTAARALVACDQPPTCWL